MSAVSVGISIFVKKIGFSDLENRFIGMLYNHFGSRTTRTTDSLDFLGMPVRV